MLKNITKAPPPKSVQKRKARVSTPDRYCIGGPEGKSITPGSKKAPDIGGLLAFAFSRGVASGVAVASARGRRERRLEWARRELSPFISRMWTWWVSRSISGPAQALGAEHGCP